MEKQESTSFEAGQKEVKLQRWSIETINLIGSTSFMSGRTSLFLQEKKFQVSLKIWELLWNSVLGTEEDKQAPGFTREDYPSGNQ